MAAQAIRDKRPAGRWLRSSSYNSADQSSIVIESLSKFFSLPTALSDPLSSRQSDTTCPANRTEFDRKFAGKAY
ncbi:MAG: hypothetical protein E6Q55_27430 [Mycolicibacterium mageritense]|nr:MAG: hypothetical protein E6Q55_27430 [Mycolicibacterium mageritense]